MRLFSGNFMLVIAMAAFGAAATRAFELRTADLLFQVEGSSAFSEAISSSTAAPSDSLAFVHVGIVEIGPEGEQMVVEASPEEGVRVVPLVRFLAEAPEVGGSPGVVAMRLSVPFPAREAVERALGHLGEPYDWWYLPANGRMYCSELIYESYLSAGGEPLFEARPMNFRRPDGSMPEFWTELYSRLGAEVPEGVPGTNPADLSRDPRLIEVGRYF